MLSKVKLIGLCCFFSAAVAAQDATQILISGDGVSITASEFVNGIYSMGPPELIDKVLASPELGKKALLEMYQFKLLAKEAKALGLDKDPVFAASIDYSITRSLASEYLRHYVETRQKPDFSDAAREHYKLNKERFFVPERVHAEHILIQTEERSEQEALALAKEIRSKVSKKGDNFADLAVEFSEDPSVEQNKGDLGFFAQGTMVQEFSDAAFAMKKGEVSQPVKSSFGYHIIRVLDHKKASYTEFDKVKDSIVEQLEREYAGKLRNERIAELKKNTPQINESLLQQLKR